MWIIGPCHLLKLLAATRCGSWTEFGGVYGTEEDFVVEFRDWLRAHPVEAGRYAQIKRELAARHAEDRDYDDYTRAKSDFLDEVQPRLRAWARDRASV
jgi:hypothetical protein